MLYDVANVPAGTGDDEGRYALTFLTELDHGIPMAYIGLIEKLAHANALMAAELDVRRAMLIVKTRKLNGGNSLLASCHLGRHLLDPGYARLHRGSTLRRLNFKFTWASWVDVDVALVLSPLVRLGLALRRPWVCLWLRYNLGRQYIDPRSGLTWVDDASNRVLSGRPVQCKRLITKVAQRRQHNDSRRAEAASKRKQPPSLDRAPALGEPQWQRRKQAGDGYGQRQAVFHVSSIKSYLRFITESRLSLRNAPRSLHAAGQLILGDEQYDRLAIDKFISRASGSRHFIEADRVVDFEFAKQIETMKSSGVWEGLSIESDEPPRNYQRIQVSNIFVPELAPRCEWMDAEYADLVLLRKVHEYLLFHRHVPNKDGMSLVETGVAQLSPLRFGLSDCFG